MEAVLKIVMLAIGIALQLFAGKVSNIYLQMLFLVIGFALLIKGADWFVEGASKIADKLGIPQLVIGLTIVAFGTSAPEAAVSITAGVSGESVDIAIGNVLGSNIMNILLILGISCLICPLAVQKSTRKYEMPFVIFITVLVLAMGHFDGQLGRVDGIIMLVLMAAFLVYLLIMAKKGQGSVEDGKEATKNDKVWKLILAVLVGGAAIVIGSNVTVNSATKIATHFGMSQRLIGLTIIAFGTSLPELITSTMAAARKKADIAIGNIVGSNIFNILFVLATTATITPLPYKSATTDFFIDNIAAIIAAVILLIGVCNKKLKLGRVCGVIMLLSYAGYFTYLLIM